MPNLPFATYPSGGLLSRQAPTEQPPPPRNPDDIPEISGSPAGFIALVIFLSFIIIFSLVGVFVLLRTPKPDPYERHARRVLAGRREDTLYQMPLGPPGLKEKVKNLFRLPQRRDGWVRASSGDADEWDASDPRKAGPSLDKHPRDSLDSASLHKSDTLESVELSAPPLDTATLPRLSYTPYSASPTALEPPARAEAGAGETPMRVFENGTRFKESL